MVAFMGIGGSDVQFLDIAFLIGAGMLFVTEFVEVFGVSNKFTAKSEKQRTK